MKKLFAFTLAALLLIGAVPVSALTNTSAFLDVATIHPNYTAVNYLRSRGLLAGFEDGSFLPFSKIKRHQLIDMIVEAKQLATSGYRNCFSDVKNQSYADEVCYAKNVGWLTGSSRKFLPKNTLKTTDAAEIVARAFGRSSTSFSVSYSAKTNRAQAAQMVYEGLTGSVGYTQPGYQPPYVPPPPANNPPVDVPPGYSPPDGGTTAGSVPAATFVATSTSITSGQAVTLSWATSGATSVSLDQGIGVVASSGTRNVAPFVSTTYTLTALNAYGTTTKYVTVMVTGASSAVVLPTATFTSSAGSSSLASGASTILSWSTSGATAVSLDQGIGVVPSTGTRTINPTSTITYTLTASNSAGTVTRSVTITVAQQTGGGTGTPAAAGTRVYAPYADMGLDPTFNMTQTAGVTGVKNYTMAFINSRGCDATWFGIVGLDDTTYNFGTDINNLRALGGEVIVSFGGATGIELAQACTTVATLQAQYQRVVTRYSLRRIDFDIEGALLANTTVNDRRAQAIAGLQAANPNLEVSFTLPVLPTGVTQNGVNFLVNAAQRGVRFTTVNLMTFDYGSAYPGDMGDLAIQAAHSVAEQLLTVYPSLSQAQRRAMIGVTPMFGKDDQQRQFTQADAQEVLTAAKNEGWARLSGWGIHRDHACPYGPTHLTCSGITQTDWEFSNVFKQFP